MTPIKKARAQMIETKMNKMDMMRQRVAIWLRVLSRKLGIAAFFPSLFARRLFIAAGK